VRKKSIELLNKAVADELAAVHQYMYFHFHLDDQGYELLSSMFRRIAIEEMLHAELLAERILFLKGEVEMEVSGPVEKITEPEEILKKAAAMEEKSVHDYNLWANESAANADSATKKIFEQLVADEEGHYDQFDTEVDQLKKFGDRYLSLQSIERSKKLESGTPAAA
jgi:bacterioferritin